MGRMKGWGLAATIVVVSVGLAALLVSLAPEPESRAPPTQVPFALSGEVASGPSAVPVFAAGTVRPSAEVNIAPQVGGKVVWVNPSFQSGGHVNSGQVLFRIESEDYEHQVRKAEADLAHRQVALLEAEQQASIARSQYERYAEQQGNANLVQDAHPLALWEPQLKAAHAALTRDESRVAEANLALSRTRVSAPWDGYVREESVDVGDILSPGQRVARLFASNAVEVAAPLSDAQATLIPGLWHLRSEHSDDRVEARVMARYGEASFAWKGYVDRAEASVDEHSRTVDLVIRIPDPFSGGALMTGLTASSQPPPLLVGKFVEVEISGVAIDNLLRIPRAALQADNEVWAVDGAGVLRIRHVRVWQRANDEAYVTGDLKVGQRVITGGLNYASDGMRVNIES